VRIPAGTCSERVKQKFPFLGLNFAQQNSRFCLPFFVVVSRIGNDAAAVEKGTAKKQKSSELAFAAPWLVPSPGTSPNLLTYWLSGNRAWQAASLAAKAPVGSTRTTASSKEQKLRIPV
jgi:hypothetical protein